MTHDTECICEGCMFLRRLDLLLEEEREESAQEYSNERITALARLGDEILGHRKALKRFRI